jgi:hypothetical protein
MSIIVIFCLILYFFNGLKKKKSLSKVKLKAAKLRFYLRLVLLNLLSLFNATRRV